VICEQAPNHGSYFAYAQLIARVTLNLPFLSHEKQRQCSGTGMGSNGRSDIIDQEAVDSEPLLHQVSYQFRRRKIIPVADEHNNHSDHGKNPFSLPYNLPMHAGIFSASHLADDNQMSFIIHMELGFNTC